MLKILDFEPVIEDNGLLPCWLCCAKLTARERVREKKNGVLEWLREIEKGGGVICEITVGCWEIDEEHKWEQEKEKVNGGRGENDPSGKEGAVH